MADIIKNDCMQPSADDIRRFEAKYVPEPNCGCWLWDGAISDTGYGSFYCQRNYISAHRFSYLIHVGNIESGFDLDHLCRVRNCVNPAHLEVVSRLQNVRRGLGGSKNRTKTHCKRGHEFTKQNTIPLAAKNGKTYRSCRECARARGRRKASL